MWYSKIYNPIQVGSIDGTATAAHDAAIERASRSEYRPPKDLETNPNCTIFVGRLGFDTAESALQQHFEEYGDISHVSIIRNKVTGLSQGYGFVTFATERAAKDAYREANKTTLDSHIILVDYERSRRMKGWIPRRLGGGYGGKKESGQLRFGARDRPFRPPSSRSLHIPSDQKRSDNWTEDDESKRRSSSLSSAKRYRRSRSRSRSRSPDKRSKRSRRSRSSSREDFSSYHHRQRKSYYSSDKHGHRHRERSPHHRK